MVFKIGSTEVINSEAAVIHESFPRLQELHKAQRLRLPLVMALRMMNLEEQLQ
jgi:hypothetical protein